jgi:hypothetical protein
MSLALVPRLALALTFGQAEPPPPADVASQLRECDAALAQRKSELARACYEALRLGHPGTPEGHDAERALMMMSLMPPLVPALTPPQGPGSEPGKTGFYVVEPYSSRTNERLRLTTWEKLDFGISGFVFGLTTGFSFAGASEADNPLAPMAAGALIYTGLAALYVNTAKIDRGDLPLVLTISLYLPSTAGLIALATETESPRAAGGVIVGAGLVALPLAYWAAASTDLDPGDTQLVRDAGFWGGVWGVAAALSVERVRERSVGVAGLVGLYGGLGLGLLAASTSDVSLERVRVTTWGGYGGAVVGGLIAAGTETDVTGLFRDLAVGSALGVLVTFISTGSIDAIPPDAHLEGKPVSSLRYLEPSLLPIVERDGRTQPRLGLNLARGRF